ncbi:hypothetical protein M9Y10_037271 [Tritrichomonas musculus]|uniref:Protein kinase domain-containing protein n=1 Tax=Tritrichomonas musculus TaxID=1915356 RepID=A0ABR2GS44_9EUKA
MEKEVYLPLFEKIISETGIVQGSKIGGGGCAEVFHFSLDEVYPDSAQPLFQNKKAGELVLKKVKRCLGAKYLLREAGLQNSVNHPFMINLTALVPLSTESGSPTNEQSFIIPLMIMPLAKLGTLDKICLSGFQKWSKSDIYHLIYGVCRSLWFLHKLRIFHRDVKTNNILVMKDKKPQISDFGYSKIKVDDMSNSVIVMSPHFAAPECYDRQTSYPSDVFSLGLVLYEIFENSSIHQYFQNAKTKMRNQGGLRGLKSKDHLIYKDENNRPPFTDKTPIAWQKLIRSMWRSDPAARVTMDEVINEIQTEKFYVDEVDFDDMQKFFEKVKEEEIEYYYVKTNETIKFLRSESSEISVSGRHDFFMPFSISPISALIDQYLRNISPHQEASQDYNNDGDDDLLEQDNLNRYNCFMNLFKILLYEINSLSKTNDCDAIVSMASYCMFHLNDYTSAYSFLINSGLIEKSPSVKNLKTLIDLESENSPVIKAMIYEATGQYNEAIDLYFDLIDKGEVEINVISHLGRLLLFLGENSDVQKEGERLLQNAINFNDAFAAFHLGIHYYTLANSLDVSEKAKREEYFTKARDLFKKIEEFPDYEMMMLLVYTKLGDTNNSRKMRFSVRGMYYET